MLSKQLLKQFYSSFIHSYLNYGNIAWGSTYKTNLASLYRSQKHAIRVINFKDRFTESKPLFKKMKILNVYEINIFQVLCFMFKCKMKTSPPIFHMIFQLKPPNKYAMRLTNTVREPICKTKVGQFSITHRAPHLWNKLIVTNPSCTQIEKLCSFKSIIKQVLASTENILQYF